MGMFKRRRTIPNITKEELLQIQAALDFMENAITDVVGWANTQNDKLKFMHESKRIHQLAKELLKEIWNRE